MGLRNFCKLLQNKPQMSSITHIRPRFKIEVDKQSEALIEKAKELLLDLPEGIVAKNRKHHFVLDVSEKAANYWSPQLQFRIEQHRDEPAKSIILGLVGPRPRVWTLFMFIYFSVGTTGVLLTLYGLSKQTLGEENGFVWALPMAIIFMLTAYKAGKIGERLGEKQVEQLKDVVRKLIR